MKRDNYYNYIDEQLHILAHRITTNGKLNMLRLHLHSENFYLHFFNLLYGYNLINLNDVSQNVEAIDLIDHDKKIMIQVSSTSSKQKIESALSKDTLKEYAGYRFKFISIAKDATDLRDKTYKNPHSIIFDPKKDIYDIRSFLNSISSLDIDKMKDVYVFIEKELGEGSKKRFDSNVLKEKYLKSFNTISLLTTNTPKPIDEIFVNLAIIKEKKEEKNNDKTINREALLSSYEEIHKPKEPIEINELVNKSNKSLIYGKAGIGKTTLCKYISYKWAKGELYSEFEYVIYIPLREWKSDSGIKGAIRDYYYSLDEKDISIDFDANKTLFLFDGYDELDANKKKALRDEIDKYALTHYLITTRPYGYQKSDFRVDEYFETIGFTDENVSDYIDNFFGKGSEKGKGLKNFLQSNISIKHIAYIPLMLEMICSLWEQKEFGSDMTMTELYTQVIEDFLEKHSQDERVYEWENREDIKELLGKIAFKGLTKQTILFDGKLIRDTIGRDRVDFFKESIVNSGFLKSDRKDKSLLGNNFEFLHLTCQEYFSALYVSKLSKEKQSDIIRDWKFYPHMQMFFTFFGGLIGDKEFLLKEIESEPRDLIGVYEFILTAHCVSEIQKEELSDIRINKINEKIINKFKNYPKYLLDNLSKVAHILNSNSVKYFIQHFKDIKSIDTKTKDKNKIIIEALIPIVKNNNELIKEFIELIKNESINSHLREIISSIFIDFDKMDVEIKDLLKKIIFDDLYRKKYYFIQIKLIESLMLQRNIDKDFLNDMIKIVKEGDSASDIELGIIDVFSKLKFYDRLDNKYIEEFLNIFNNNDVNKVTRNYIAYKHLLDEKITKETINSCEKDIEKEFEEYNDQDDKYTPIPFPSCYYNNNYIYVHMMGMEGTIPPEKNVDELLQYYKECHNNPKELFNMIEENTLALNPHPFKPTWNNNGIDNIDMSTLIQAYCLNYNVFDYLYSKIKKEEAPFYVQNNNLYVMYREKKLMIKENITEETLNDIKMLLNGDNSND